MSESKACRKVKSPTYISRIAGTGVVLENSGWQALRQSKWATVYPSIGCLDSWVHFVVPTPYQLKDGDRLRAFTAAVHFQTSGSAKVTQFYVADEDNPLLNNIDLNLTPHQMSWESRNIPNQPFFLYSLV